MHLVVPVNKAKKEPSESAREFKPHAHQTAVQSVNLKSKRLLILKIIGGVVAVSAVVGLVLYHSLLGRWVQPSPTPRSPAADTLTVAPLRSPLVLACPVCPSYPELRTGPSAVSAVSSASTLIPSILRRKRASSSPATFEYVFVGAPLQFLQVRLGRFKTARRIFASRDWMPATAIASEFHKACDGVPNVLVIIKSGQYIAGGYTEVPFQSLAYSTTNTHMVPNAKMSTFMFSVNYQEIYPLINKDFALDSRKEWGPSFGGASANNVGYFGLQVNNDYISNNNIVANAAAASNFLGFEDGKIRDNDVTAPNTGGIMIDEYEVYQLIE